MGHGPELRWWCCTSGCVNRCYGVYLRAEQLEAKARHGPRRALRGEARGSEGQRAAARHYMAPPRFSSSELAAAIRPVVESMGSFSWAVVGQDRRLRMHKC